MTRLIFRLTPILHHHGMRLRGREGSTLAAGRDHDRQRQFPGLGRHLTSRLQLIHINDKVLNPCGVACDLTSPKVASVLTRTATQVRVYQVKGFNFR